MNSAYLILVPNSDAQVSSLQPRAGLDSSLMKVGMRLVSRVGQACVYTTEHTNSCVLPDGGVIIGELFSRSGHRIRSTSQIPNLDSGELRRHITGHFWGDYILVLPATASPGALWVTRSPSPVGEPPCVYSTTEGWTFFTSSPSLAVDLGIHRKRIDFNQLAHRLVYPGIKPSRTAWSGLKELLPGTSARFGDDRLIIETTWNPWTFANPDRHIPEITEAAAAVREATEMVISTLAKEDGSLLLELSGGLDSSVVAACLHRTTARLSCTTLTALIPGADEVEYGALVADMLGTELAVHELDLRDARLEFELHPDLLTPMAGPLQNLIDEAMSAEADRVAARSFFTGAGGDTVFCYLKSAAPIADAVRLGGPATALRALHHVSAFHQCTYWTALKLTLRKLLRPDSTLHKVDRSFIEPSMGLPELQRHPWLASTPVDALPGDRERIFDLVGTQFYRDSSRRAFTRPLRMPLLSQPVVEACLQVPSWLWFSGGHNRAVARYGFSDRLPSRVLSRKSKGSFTNFLGSLYERKIRDVKKFLMEGELSANGVIDPDAIRRLPEDFIPRSDTSFTRLLSLCATENWVRQQRV